MGNSQHTHPLSYFSFVHIEGNDQEDQLGMQNHKEHIWNILFAQKWSTSVTTNSVAYFTRGYEALVGNQIKWKK
jgi:hypothetical protein